MTIRAKLAVAPVLVILLGLAAAGSVWYLNAERDQRRAIAVAIERQGLYLQQLLRGINESILTNGTPESISVAETAITEMDRALETLRARSSWYPGHADAFEAVQTRWTALKAGLSPFLQVNDVDASDEMLVDYGRLLTVADGLHHAATSLAEQSRDEAARTARHVARLIMLVGLMVGLMFALLSVHLYRSIALPIDRLQRSMQHVSTLGSAGVERIGGSNREVERDSVQANDTGDEIDALTRTFTTMRDRIHTHLGKRQRAEQELNRLNASLEQQVEERTQVLQEALDTLGKSERRFRSLYEEAPLAYQSLDQQGRILEVNRAWLAMLGYDREEVIGRFIGDFMLEKDLALLEERFPRFVRTGEIQCAEFDFRRKGGGVVTVSVDGTIGYDLSARTPQTHCILTNVTERRRAEAELRLAAEVIENTAEGVLITDPSNAIVSVNRAFTEITGYPRQEMLGRNPSLLASGRHDRGFYEAMWRTLEKTGHWQGEIWNRKKSGEVFPEWLSVSTVRDEAARIVHYVGIFSDITGIKQSEAQLTHLAHHDALTGLPNRLLISDRIDHALHRARRDGNEVAVFFLDLDRFKHLNDSLGHAVGDQLLQQVTGRLSACMRDSDSVGRIGGDEFIVVVDEVQRVTDVGAIAQKVLDDFTDPFQLDSHQLHVTPSIGISLFPADGHDALTLIRNADSAMYRAKEEGRNNYQFYTPDLTQKATERVQVENDLRHAMARDEFIVYYQPQVNLETAAVLGAEALIRWRHPTKGLVPPMSFVPLAEDTGLIQQIGEWVLVSACRQWLRWLDSGLVHGRVSVNLSSRQIDHGDIVETIRRSLETAGLEPRYLTLEMTEGVLMRETSRTVEVLEELRELGIQLAIDDFGTGHSSLSRLKQLPINTLKIDRAFVKDIHTDPDAQAIAQAIIALSNSLKLTVIAEGVENEQERAFLFAKGCTLGQGYLYCKPLPPDEFENYAEKRRTPPTKHTATV